MMLMAPAKTTWSYLMRSLISAGTSSSLGNLMYGRILTPSFHVCGAMWTLPSGPPASSRLIHHSNPLCWLGCQR